MGERDDDKHRATMRWASLATALAAVVALSACGESPSKTTNEGSSKTTSGQLPPAQYENGQRIEGYFLAVKKMNAPFEHPPSEPTNYAKATQLSRTAVAELAALTPPPQFKAAHEKLLAALRAQVATGREFESAQRTHDPTAISNAEAKNVRRGEEIREALKEMAVELERCKQDSFTC
jgi:hypothetical protein